MEEISKVYAIFDDPSRAQAALRQLRGNGFGEEQAWHEPAKPELVVVQAGNRYEEANSVLRQCGASRRQMLLGQASICEAAVAGDYLGLD